MVEIGGKPILWHLLKIYSHFSIQDFIVCCGYKGYAIKEYFANYCLHNSDVTFDMAGGRMQVHRQHIESWSVTLVDTGELTNTAGRLKRVAPYLNDEPFCLTYGDGLADVNLHELIAAHQSNGCAATLTAVQPPGRYGSLKLQSDGQVQAFVEKPQGDGGWINGGFFVVNPSVLNLIDGDQTSWEADVLPRLAASGQLAAYQHRGFWQAMDTLRDRNQLQSLWEQGRAPWKLWE